MYSNFKQASCIIAIYLEFGISVGLTMSISQKYRPFMIFAVPIAILLMFLGIFKEVSHDK